MRSAAYETESVEPLLVWRGRLTFQADVRHESATSAANDGASGMVVGKNVTIRNDAAGDDARRHRAGPAAAASSSRGRWPATPRLPRGGRPDGAGIRRDWGRERSAWASSPRCSSVRCSSGSPDHVLGPRGAPHHGVLVVGRRCPTRLCPRCRRTSPTRPCPRWCRCCPRRCASSSGDQLLFWQSAPPHAGPQTTLTELPLQPGIRAESFPTLLVPAASQSAVEHMTPHVAVCPPGIVAVPQTTVVAHALAVAVSRPPRRADCPR